MPSSLDPRTLALAALSLTVSILIADPGLAVWLWIPVWAAGLLVLSPRMLRGAAKAALLMSAITLVVNGFLVGGERVGPEALGPFRPTKEGLEIGIVQAARLSALVVVSVWGMARISGMDLAASLEYTVRGVSSLRGPVHRFVFPLMLAARMIPVMREEGVRLHQIQTLRRGPGAGPMSITGLVSLVPAWLSMVVERAEGLGLALTLRGYRPDRVPAPVKSYRLHMLDWLVIAGSCLLPWWVHASL